MEILVFLRWIDVCERWHLLAYWRSVTVTVEPFRAGRIVQNTGLWSVRWLSTSGVDPWRSKKKQDLIAYGRTRRRGTG